MSSLRLFYGANPFDELVDKATSELLPAGQEDLALNLEIAEQVRGKQQGNAKDAMRSLKRRLSHKNPNVQLLALGLTDTCVKNGGDHFLVEIASREFLDDLVAIIKAPRCNSDVKTKILGLIQTWGIATRGKSGLGHLTDTYHHLKAEGFVFPPTDKTDSIFLETSAPPEWNDSTVCERCRTPFTMTNRKHHCRQCGKTFCGQCSSKSMTLPHLGITQEVRVCDGCYIKRQLVNGERGSSGASSATQPSSFSTGFPPANYGGAFSTGAALQGANLSAAASNPAVVRTSSGVAVVATDDFEADMRKAIELSLKESDRGVRGAGYAPAAAVKKVVQEPPKPAPARTQTGEEEEDPDLAAAIAASLRETHISSSSQAYSSSRTQSPYTSSYNPSAYPAPLNVHDLSTVEIEKIQMFSTLIERIQESNGEIVGDRQIQDLYEQIGTMQPKLVKNLDETNRKHQNYVELHEKLNTVVKLYERLLEERVARASNYYTPRPVPAVLPSTSITAYPPVSPVTTPQNLYPTLNTYASSPFPAYTYPQAPPAQAPTVSYPAATAPPAQSALYTYAAYAPPPQQAYAPLPSTATPQPQFTNTAPASAYYPPQAPAASMATAVQQPSQYDQQQYQQPLSNGYAQLATAQQAYYAPVAQQQQQQQQQIPQQVPQQRVVEEAPLIEL